MTKQETVKLGSPPRVRGTVQHGLHIQMVIGITPARAGNSHVLRNDFRVSRDHPRACGEQVGWSIGGIRARGSPPRVRGTVLSSMLKGGGSRITPARAGNSIISFVKNPINKDHPRACGEQTMEDK